MKMRTVARARPLASANTTCFFLRSVPRPGEYEDRELLELEDDSEDDGEEGESLAL